MSRACIALGSNVGDRRANLAGALALLDQSPGVTRLRASEFVETDPVDCPPDAAAFLNAAAVLETALPPRDLLNRLLEIERELGRRRASEAKNAPRALDLDLLLYDEQVISSPGLVIPHPRMHERCFVLIPLAQVAPEARHPVVGRTVAELLADLSCGAAYVSPDRAAARSG